MPTPEIYGPTEWPEHDEPLAGPVHLHRDASPDGNTTREWDARPWYLTDTDTGHRSADGYRTRAAAAEAQVFGTVDWTHPGDREDDAR